MNGSPMPAVTISAFSAALEEPEGLALDSSGDLWVANYSMSDGTLLTNAGAKGVYVGYKGSPWAFRSMGQLFADGYGGTPAVPVPGPAPAGAVVRYSGT